MSNNYNQTLQSNNIDLQAILDTVNELPNAGGSEPILQDKTVTPTTSVQKVTADNNYDGLNEVTVNAMPTATQATPTISINSSTGLITATATQTAGYVAAGTKSATKQLAFQAAQTITPGTTNKTIAANTYLGGVQTIKGDANLVAGNIKSGTSIFGVTGTYTGSGGSGGDTSIEDGLITRTLSSYTNSRVTAIGPGAFYACTSLETVSFPNVTDIGNAAFLECTRLTTVSFPKAYGVGASAFSNCSYLTTVYMPTAEFLNEAAFRDCKSLSNINFPSCKTIHNSAFNGCTSLTSVSFPACTSIGASAFTRCSSLTSVSFPACTNIGSNAFAYCLNLNYVSFPACTQIDGYAFVWCSSLTSVSFPKVLNVYSYAFEYCSSLECVSFPKLITLGPYAFYSCPKLSSIYLLGSSTCFLSKSNAFSNTGIWSDKGSIFVPASLLAKYKSSTNWAYFSNRIFSA